jgi:hypothetical protein
MLRFLRRKQNNVKEAAKMFSAFLKWRDANNVDDIRNQILYGGVDSPYKFPNGRKIIELAPQIVISPKAQDKQGQPLGMALVLQHPITSLSLTVLFICEFSGGAVLVLAVRAVLPRHTEGLSAVPHVFCGVPGLGGGADESRARVRVPGEASQYRRVDRGIRRGATDFLHSRLERFDVFPITDAVVFVFSC